MTTVNRSVRPYFDDFDPDKSYYNVLFRPSYAVQTRELNQMQSMFEQQLTYFGNNIFKNGSIVIPGALNYDNQYQYVKVVIDDYDNKIEAIKSGANLRIITQDDGVIANVLQFTDIDNDDPATFFVLYVNSGATNTVTQFGTGKSCNILAPDDTLVATATISEVGLGTKASVDTGVYYAQGRFVYVPAQTVIVSKYSQTPDASIGFDYVESVITENDDPTLVDNANGSSNYTAPGAHRLRIDLNLVAYASGATQASGYIELMKMVGGIVSQQARGPEYNVLGQTLAQRTYEESGDYAVKPFAIDLTEDLLVPDSNVDGRATEADGGDGSKYDVIIDPGLAYVRGYRVELLKSITRIVDKARDTSVSNNAPATLNYGNFVNFLLDDKRYGSPITSLYQKVSFYNAVVTVAGTPAGSIIGSAYVRTVYYGETQGSLYIFNIKNAAGNPDTSFLANAKSVAGNSFTANLLTPVAIYQTNTNGAIVPLNYSWVKSLLDVNAATDTNYQVLRRFTATSNASSEVVLTAGANESFITWNSSYSQVINSSSGATIPVTSAVLGGTPSGSTLTLTLGTGGASVSVIIMAQLDKQQAVQRNKTISSGTATGTQTSGILSLGKNDVFAITSVKDTNDVDVTSKFTLNKNVTMDYYGISYVNAPTSGIDYPVTVEFQYFLHGSGDYYSVDSYSAVDYNLIPTFNGLRLADCLDFRPDLDTSGNPIGGTDVIYQGSLIAADITYYLPRIDKVYVTQDGIFDVIKGTSSLNPVEPATPTNSMELATISLGAYTPNANILPKTIVPNKRYTMADIGSLDNRIKNLEYYVSLNLLEQQTANANIYDDSGLDRFKNGFITDSFVDHSVGDWTWSAYHCSVGPMSSAPNALRPEYSLNAIDVTLNEDDSSNIVVKNGLAFLSYTEVDYISQPQGSSTSNVNPYAVFKWDGSVSMNPSTDNWIDVVYNAPKVNYTVLQNGNLQQSWQALGLAWNAGSSSYSTTSSSSSSQVIGNTKVSQNQNLGVIGFLSDDNSDGVYKGIWNNRPAYLKDVQQTVQTTSALTVTTSNTNTSVDEIGDYLLSQSAIPYIRSKDVVVVVKGMKPLTKMFFFFDNINVGQWVKPSTSGNYGDAIVTDSKGAATAIFTIPDDATQKFRVGSRVLDVTDSSANDSLSAQAYGSATYTAMGLLDTRQKEYNATRSVDTSSSSINVVSTDVVSTPQLINYYDPLAESFLVDQDGGAFVTSLELFFAQKDASVAISVAIQGMDNGFPTQDIIPGSQVTLTPDQVNVSSDGSVGTTFTFDYPVSLKQGVEYCFVVHSNSDKYYIYKASMGEVDLLSNQVISKQPFIGVMFKSQNSSTWSADQLSDLKFKLKRASFNTASNGVIVLNNVEPASIPLVANPITTYSGNNYIDLAIPDGHGFIVGSTITVSGLVGDNGFADTDLNKDLVVSSIVSPAVVRITTDVTATASGQIGGLNGIRSNSFQYTMLNPSIETVTFDSTSVGYEFKGVGGQSYSGTETPYDTTSGFQQLANNTLNFLDRPYMVLTDAEETSHLSGDKSFALRVTIQSTKENVSPVIDLQRTTLVSPMFLVDSVSPDANDGYDCYARYRTIPFNIGNPTTAFQTYFDAYIPTNGKIIYSIRFGNTLQELNTATWIATGTFTTAGTPYFEEYDNLYELSDKVTWFQVMIQLKSQSAADVPQVRNLRVIALGT